MQRHKAQRHRVERHRVERHNSREDGGASYEAQLTAPGFVRLFTDMYDKPQHSTQAEAYIAAEQYHVEQYGAARFASYYSFRQALKNWENRV